MKTLVNRISSSGLPLVCNRESIGQDGWIHIVPKGDLPHAEAGVVQVLDDTALDAILANLRADAAKLGNRWPGLYGGEEHFIYDAEKSSEAFWWGKEFEKRADGIWGKGEATDVGAPALQNKRFKFTSFVTDPKVPGSIERLDGNRVRVLRVDTVGFTNFANGKHLLSPITNRNPLPDSPADAPTGEQADNNTIMKLINTKLGLSADANEASALEALDKLLNRATKAETDLGALQPKYDLLTNRVSELLGEQIDADLATAGVTDADTIAKVKPVLEAMKNREARVDFIGLLGSKAAPSKEVKPLTNRTTAKAPTGKGAETPSEEELAQKAESEITTYRLQNRCSYAQARNAVRDAKPELFGLTR